MPIRSSCRVPDTLPPLPRCREVARLELERGEVEDRIRIAGIDAQRPSEIASRGRSSPTGSHQPRKVEPSLGELWVKRDRPLKLPLRLHRLPGRSQAVAAIEGGDRVEGIGRQASTKERRRLRIGARSLRRLGRGEELVRILPRLAEPKQQLPIELTEPASLARIDLSRPNLQRLCRQRHRRPEPMQGADDRAPGGAACDEPGVLPRQDQVAEREGPGIALETIEQRQHLEIGPPQSRLRRQRRHIEPVSKPPNRRPGTAGTHSRSESSGRLPQSRDLCRNLRVLASRQQRPPEHNKRCRPRHPASKPPAPRRNFPRRKPSWQR